VQSASVIVPVLNRPPPLTAELPDRVLLLTVSVPKLQMPPPSKPAELSLTELWSSVTWPPWL
jgi:hypothetical protein